MGYEDGFALEQDEDHGWWISTPWGYPVGQRLDFYSGGKEVPMQVLKNPFPKELSETLRCPRRKYTKEEMEEILARLKNHVRAVIDHVPKSKKVGSSQFWKP